ncbi:MAG: hypothetical protein JST91_13275 [Actinobacteria bacterium]|nr:hypothetical protein [Actinomycetota bacterium]
MFDDDDRDAYPADWPLDAPHDHLADYRDPAVSARIADMLRSHVEHRHVDSGRSARDVLQLIADTHRASIAPKGDPWAAVLVALVDLASRRLDDALGRELAVMRLSDEVDEFRRDAAREAGAQ